MATPFSPADLLDTAALADGLARDGGDIVDAVRSGDPAAPVPGCPGWGLADLGAHVHSIWHRVPHAIGAGILPMAVEPPPPVAAGALADAMAASLAGLQAVLASGRPDDPAVTWAGPPTLGFWMRRMAAEALVHRIDADQALGRPPSADPASAADALDEYLDWILPLRAPDRLSTPLRLEATDAGVLWDVGSGGAPVAVARGSAVDLLLAVMGRSGRDALEADGDEAALDSWLAVPAF